MNIKIGTIPNDGTHTSIRLEDCNGLVTVTDNAGVDSAVTFDGVQAFGEAVFTVTGEAGQELTSAEKATLRDEYTAEIKRVAKLIGPPNANKQILYFSNLTALTLTSV